MKKSRILSILALSFTLLLHSCNKDRPEPSKPTPKPGDDDGNPTTEIILPKNEMRAVWIATAWGLDWPIGVYGEAQQKQTYITMLDKFQELKVNTIFFQVKAMGDAFYNSPYEPWAASITGTRGQDPGYDVLKFLVDEAHDRGMEFHAWMNPYRISTRANAGANYPTLHSSISADWVVNHEKIQIYNPAVPEVRTRLVDIIRDILAKYDVDGIHFDDYFYPDPTSAGTMVSDAADYAQYGAEYSSIEAFRRGNVDKAIQGVHEAIVATKPAVVFSVSPAASKNYNYNTLYADVAKWCQQGWLDLLIPQLYQEIGNSSNDFRANLADWSQNSYDAALVIGHAIYKFGDAAQPAAFQSADELERQFELTRKDTKAMGSVLYSAKSVMDNKIGITNKIAALYSNPAVMPFIGRSSAADPTVVANVKVEGNILKWDKNNNERFVVYYTDDLKKTGQVVVITDQNSLTISMNGYYCVTALNKDNKESAASEAVEY